MSTARRVLLQACVVAAGLAVPPAVLAQAASEALSLQGDGMASARSSRPAARPSRSASR